MIVNNNTPSIGFIEWKDVKISYKGTTYTIVDGNTNLMYIYWKYSDPTNFYGSNAFPTLGADDLLVFLNKLGTHVKVPNATVLDGSLIVPESILTGALAANSVTSEKIIAGAITANELAAGSVGANAIAANAISADKLVAGTITATSGVIAAAAITNAAIANGAITNAKINDLDAGKINAGTINAARIGTSTISVDKLAAGGRNPNMIYHGFDDWNNHPVGYTPNGTQTGFSVMQVTEETDTPIGKRCLKLVNATGGSTQPYKYLHPTVAGSSSGFLSPIVAGKSYIHSVFVKTTSAVAFDAQLSLVYKDAANASLTTAAAVRPNIVASNGWVRIFLKSTAPANAVSATLYFRHSKYDVAYTTYWTGLQLEEAETGQIEPSVYKGGGATVIDGGNITANSVTATQIAANTVTATEIKTGTITAASGILADAVITSAKIANLAVGTAAIADLAVTNAKINDLSVSKLSAGTIDVDKGITVSSSTGGVTIDQNGVNVKNGNFTLTDVEGGSILKYDLAVGNNLINDHSFEMIGFTGSPDATYGDYAVKQTTTSPFAWVVTGSPRIIVDRELDTQNAIFGDRSLVVNSQNSVYTTVKAKAGSTYTVSGHFIKGSRGASSSNPRIIVNVQKGVQYIGDEGGWTTVSTSTTPSPIPVGRFPNKPARHAVTVTTPTLTQAEIDAGYILRLKVTVNAGTTAWVVADGMQVVENTIPSMYEPEQSLWRMRRGSDSIPMFDSDTMMVDGTITYLTVLDKLDFGVAHGGGLYIDPANQRANYLPEKDVEILQRTTSSLGGMVIRSSLDTTGVAGHLWGGTGGFVIDSYYGDMSGGRNLHLRTGGFESFVIRHNSNASLSFASASSMLIIGDSGGDGELVRLEGDTHTYMTFYKGGTRLGWVGDGSTTSDNISLWGLNDVNIVPSNGAPFVFSSVTNGGIDFGQSKLKFLYSTGTIQARNAADSAYVPMNASAFTVNSEREVKTNIEKTAEGALAMVEATAVYDYHLKDELNEYSEEGKAVVRKKDAKKVKRRKGLILDEAPPEIVDGDGIDLYAMNATLWKAVQELSAEVKQLRKKIIKAI